MGCMRTVVKCLLFAFNVIFTGVGISLIVLGIIILTNVGDITWPEGIEGEEFKEVLNWAAILITSLGVFVFVVSFSGCCGALTETKCLLMTFAVFTLMLIIAKLYLVIVWNKNTDVLRNFTKDYLNETFTSPDNQTFHAIEISLQCCGTTGHDSYEEPLPPSCCGEESIHLEDECLRENAFGIGCLNAIDELILDATKQIKSVLIWIIVFEVLEFVGSVYLTCSINKRKKLNYH